MIEAVVFDCFGTLLELQAEAYFGTKQLGAFELLKTSKPELAYDEFEQTWGSVFLDMETTARQSGDEFSMHELVIKLQQRLGTAVDHKELVDVYLEGWMVCLRPIPGVPEMLQRLAATKKLAVLSNTYHPPLVPAVLEFAGIDPSLFDVITTSVEFGRRKPDAAILAAVLAELNVAPDCAVMVGDSLTDDFGVARAAGTRCLLVGGAERADNRFVSGSYLPIKSILEVERYV